MANFSHWIDWVKELLRLRELGRQSTMSDGAEPPKDQQGQAGKPSGPEAQGRRPQGSSRSLWIGLALAGAVLLLFTLSGQVSRVEIPYSELVALIEKGSPDRNPNAFIELKERFGTQIRTVRYSELSDLVVGSYQITGRVTRQVVAPRQEAPQRRVPFRTARLGFENDNNYLFSLLKQNGFTNVRAEDPPGAWQYFLSFILPLVVLMVVFVFLLRRFGGPGGAIAFGRSRAKFFMREQVGVTFADVAGIDEAVEEVKEIVEFLKNPEKFRALGGRIPRGVLLVGPPGTGKTLLAKAIAGEAGVPFFSISGSDFVEMFVGVGAARVRDMFQQAQANSPCIVFIDELDALGKTRGMSVLSSHDEREQTLNALLVEMDGFSSTSGVIVLGATNRPEILDPALLRPGRFDRHILVDRPDLRGREAILKVHVRNVKLDPSVDLAQIAAMTPGFVGADLANLVNEAALLAARKGKNAVTMEEFVEGVERVTAGLEKKQRIISPEERRRVAYHESGHALVAYCLPNTDPVQKVSIIPRGLAALGYTLQRPEGDRYLLTQSELEARIQVALAGSVAEEMIFHDLSTGAQNDIQRATEIARAMVMDFGMSRLGRIAFRENRQSVFLARGLEMPEEHLFSEQTAREIDMEIRRIIDEALAKTRHILEVHRDALEALAERLIQKEVLDTAELREVIEAYLPSRKAQPAETSAEKVAKDGGDGPQPAPLAETDSDQKPPVPVPAA
ncbi:MAG: ATP-dependent zinc metalloprotease FtsH [Thermoguttaceae bacterium]|nr:ATP-dependent zinc metalloprotease FtsH [Thermoguttaceae bacterium]MDW8078998.1 ATP-dependent zinc metalloprotease FtsH [Thermoguttaceae bacterium]